MKKVGLLFLCLLISTVLITGSAFAQAPKVKIMKIGHQMNPEHPDHLGTVKFKEIVEAETKGSVKVEIYPSDQLGSFFTQMQNLKQGIQQGHVNGLGIPWPFCS